MNDPNSKFVSYLKLIMFVVFNCIKMKYNLKLNILGLVFTIFLVSLALPSHSSEYRPFTSSSQQAKLKKKRPKLKFKDKIKLWLLKKAIKKSQKPVNKKAKLGLLFSILALLVPFVGFILLVLGFVFSFKALKELKSPDNEERGKGLAIAGISLGFAAIIASIVALSLLVNVF